ncbi:LexA family protein [Bacillus toyonensis]|nr:hypothetical protein [Bacillus toyonensis]
MKSLTPRQTQVLNFIQQKATENGYPPTVREIEESLDISSPFYYI